MQKSVLVYFVFFTSILFGQQTATGAEVADFNFPKIKSSLSMPIKIPLVEIGNIINNSVKNLIFEDNSFTDNDND